MDFLERAVNIAIQIRKLANTVRVLDSRHPLPPQDYMPHAKALGSKAKAYVC